MVIDYMSVAAPSAAPSDETPELIWRDQRPQPPNPILTLHCTAMEPRTFSWVGLRLSGMGDTIAEDRHESIGGVAGGFGVLVRCLVPRKLFKNARQGTVDVVDRMGATHTWSIADFIDATIVHSIPGGDSLPADRGGPCAIVSLTNKFVANIETITVKVTG